MTVVTLIADFLIINFYAVIVFFSLNPYLAYQIYLNRWIQLTHTLSVLSGEILLELHRFPTCNVRMTQACFALPYFSNICIGCCHNFFPIFCIFTNLLLSSYIYGSVRDADWSFLPIYRLFYAKLFKIISQSGFVLLWLKNARFSCPVFRHIFDILL